LNTSCCCQILIMSTPVKGRRIQTFSASTTDATIQEKARHLVSKLIGFESNCKRATSSSTGSGPRIGVSCPAASVMYKLTLIFLLTTACAISADNPPNLLYHQTIAFFCPSQGQKECYGVHRSNEHTLSQRSRKFFLSVPMSRLDRIIRLLQHWRDI